MDERFETIIQEGINHYLSLKGLNLSTANNVKLGYALTEFYIKEIGRFLYDIYEDDVSDGLLCDGKNDMNIDFAYRNEKSVIIIQSKYRGVRSSLKTDELAGFFNIHSRLTNEVYFNRYANNSVKNAIGIYSEENTYTYIFISNDKASEAIISEFNRLKEEKEAIFSNVNYEFKPFTEIKRDYREITSELESIEGEVEINIEKVFDTISNNHKPAYLDLTQFIGSESGYQSIICTIKGTSLKQLWDQHKARLFNYNIRGYLGTNPINKKIESTLNDEPDKFYFYNNGISAICTKLEAIYHGPEVNKLRCSNFQIINGAQTTSTIGRFKNVDKLQKVRVLLRITKAEDYKKEKGLNKNIITYNNSQSIIKAADFRSNDEIQVFLEKKLPNFLYKGVIPYQSVKYQRKRLKVDKRKDVLLINIDTLARVLYAFDHEPVLIFKGTKYLFDTDENAGKYWTVFGENNQEVEFFDEKRLNKTIALYFIWTKIEQLLKEESRKLKSLQQESTIEYQALLPKWHFLWSYGYILTSYYSDDIDKIYKRIANGKIFEKSESFIDVWFKRIHSNIGKTIEQQYKSEGDDEIQGFNLKNWLRNTSDFEKLKKEFKWSHKVDYPIDHIQTP